VRNAPQELIMKPSQSTLRKALRLTSAIAAALLFIGLILRSLSPAAAAPMPVIQQTYDLQVNTLGPNSIVIGQPFTYTLNITNSTASTLDGVVITDTWTAQDYDGSYTTSGTISVSSAVYVTQPIRYMQFNVMQLAPGAIGSIQMGMVISTVYQPGVGTPPLVVGNNALITTTTPNKTSNNDSVNTIVVGPVFNFLPHVSPDPVRPGRLVTFSFSLENRNRSDAIDAINTVFTTTVPDYAEVYSLSAPALATATVGTSGVVWQIPVIPVSTTTYVTLTARVLPTIAYGIKFYYAAWCAGMANTQVFPVQCADNDSTHIDNVFEKPAETVSPPVQDSPVKQTFPARVVSYTVYIYNPFTQTASLRITDTLPRYEGLGDYSFQYLGLSNSNSNPPTNVTALPGGIVGWTTPPIAGWGVYSFTFNAWLPPTMPIPPNSQYYDFYNSVNGSYGDIMLPALAIGSHSNWVVREVPQVLIAKTVTPMSQMPGLPVTYTVVLSNSGPTIVRNIQITDVLPSNVACSFTYGRAVSGPAPTVTSTGYASWNNITLTAYTQWTTSFSAIANGGTNYTCFNSIYGASTDSYIEEKDYLAPVAIDGPFRSDKTVIPSTVVLGGQISYTVMEWNVGGEDAVMNGFTDTLPSGFLYGSSPIYTDRVGVPLTLLANGANTYQSTFPVNVVSAPACDSLPRNIPQGVATYGMHISSPPRLTGNWFNPSSAAPLIVLPQATADVSAAPSAVIPHGIVTFTVVLSNNTGTTYSLVRVTDTLPAGVVFGGVLSGTAAPASTGPEVVWTSQIIPANGIRTLSFTATVNIVTPGSYVNFAKATSDASAVVCVPRAQTSIKVGQPLVTIVKTPSQSSAGPLSKFSYDIAFYNFAPVSVTIQRFTDTLPGLVSRWRYDSMLNLSDPQPISTNPPVWLNLVIPAAPSANQVGIYHLIVNVRTGTEFGTFLNLQASNPPPVGAGQFTGTIQAGWVLTADGSFNGAPVTVVPGVGLDKVVSPGPVANGDSVVYTITVVNLSGANIDNVVVSDTLPSGFSYEATVSGSPPTTTSPLVWPLGTVQNGDNHKVVFSFRARVWISEPSGIYYNRVNATSPSINIPATDDIAPVQVNSTIGPHPDLILSKSDGRGAVTIGDIVTYTVFYTNSGDAPASGIVLTESPPGNISFVGGSAWALIAGNRFTLTVPDLSMNQSASVTFSVQIMGAAPDGRYTNTVQIGTRDEVNMANDTAIDVDLLQRLDARVTVDDHLTSVRAGQVLAYVIGYTNTGNDLVNNIILTETLVPGLNYSGAVWSALGGGVFTRSVGSLASGISATATLIAQVDAGITGGSSVTNTAQIGFSGIDVNPADNTAMDVDTVPPPDMYLFQDDGVAIVGANQFLTYTFYYRNMGGTLAGSVVITETPPASVTIQDFSGWLQNGGTYSYTVGSVAPGATGTVAMAARVNSGVGLGTLLTSTSRIAAAADSNPANDRSTDVDIVQASGPDLKITGVYTGSPAVGLPETIVVTVTNIGTAGTTTWFYTDLYMDRVPLNRTDLGDDFKYISAPATRHQPSKVESLAPGQSVQVEYQVMFNDTTTHQLYFQADTCDLAGACLDASYGRIAETNEANNVFGPISLTAVSPHVLYLPVVRK
jgi:uncharacterized repeat protein (TIGR01451 family)